MRILWTLLKVILGLAIAIPLGLIVLGLAAGLLGTLVGIAILALKLACLAFVGYGAYRVVRMFIAPSPTQKRAVPELSAPDPYYEAAMRDLDAEIEGRAR